MLALNESQAGPPGAVPDHLYAWAAEQVYTLAKEQGAQPEGLVENVQAFIAAVDWSETWIQALLATHVLLWLLVLVFRKNMTFQGVMFILISISVRGAEYINTLLREKYWQSFATQNYFDERGVFAVIMFAGPMIALAMVQVSIFLFTAAHMLVAVKRAELSRKKKE